MSRSDSHERRLSDRLYLDLNAAYAFLLLPKWAYSATRDVSGKGICLKLDRSLRKGKKLRLQISFPKDPRPISLVSEVVWSRANESGEGPRFEAGFRHLYIHPRDRDRFVQLFCETMLEYFFEKGSIHA